MANIYRRCHARQSPGFRKTRGQMKRLVNRLKLHLSLVILVKVVGEAQTKHLIVEVVECEEDIIRLFNTRLIVNGCMPLTPSLVSLLERAWRKSLRSLTGG